MELLEKKKAAALETVDAAEREKNPISIAQTMKGLFRLRSQPRMEFWMLSDVAELRFFQEYTAPEIAERLQIPEGTVKSRLNMIRRRLREYLDMESPVEKKKA